MLKQTGPWPPAHGVTESARAGGGSTPKERADAPTAELHR